jgi:Ser/Thr protein kinase RdoA (MazF antagonist)
MHRIPALPLHPSVYQTALMQLANGASLTDIQQRNREWVANGGDGLIAKHGKDWKHRWLLQRYDSWSLYHQFSRLHGVKVSEKPHIHLHEWFNPQSRQ